MRPCERTDLLLSAYIEGETSPAETRFLDSHLASCPRCRDQKAEMEALLSRIHSLPRVEVSPGFTERVLARTSGLEPAGIEAVPAVTPISSRRSWSVPLAAAAALLVVVWGVNRMQSNGTPGPVTARGPAVSAPVESPPQAATGTDVADNTAAGPADAKRPLDVQHMGGAENEGVWLDGDAYVLDSYELREPAGGGSPTLTRASGQVKDKVVVTF